MPDTAATAKMAIPPPAGTAPMPQLKGGGDGSSESSGASVVDVILSAASMAAMLGGAIYVYTILQ